MVPAAFPIAVRPTRLVLRGRRAVVSVRVDLTQGSQRRPRDDTDRCRAQRRSALCPFALGDGTQTVTKASGHRHPTPDLPTNRLVRILNNPPSNHEPFDRLSGYRVNRFAVAVEALIMARGVSPVHHQGFRLTPRVIRLAGAGPGRRLPISWCGPTAPVTQDEGAVRPWDSASVIEQRKTCRRQKTVAAMEFATTPHRTDLLGTSSHAGPSTQGSTPLRMTMLSPRSMQQNRSWPRPNVPKSFQRNAETA